MGMRPYYLYRKNICWEYGECGVCHSRKESIYNIQIMEDRQTIWAFGAAAITKAVYPVMGRIERAANVKNIEDYINRVDEMVERKLRLCSYS